MHGFADASIDDIELTDCFEKLYYEDLCSQTDDAVYQCASGSECIEPDRLCDMKSDCRDGDDEDSTIHNCSKIFNFFSSIFHFFAFRF